MANGDRWSIALLVVVVASLVVIWPRGGSDDASGPPASSSSPSAAPLEEDADLALLRQRVALQPCPNPNHDTIQPNGPLAGVPRSASELPRWSLSGKATLLNLWAPWRVPCREEIPVLVRDCAERPDSILVLGINGKESASTGLAFMAEIGVHYPSLHEGEEGEETMQRALNTPPALPVNYLVRPDGTVERVTNPLVFRGADEIQATVDRLPVTANAACGRT